MNICSKWTRMAVCYNGHRFGKEIACDNPLCKICEYLKDTYWNRLELDYGVCTVCGQKLGWLSREECGIVHIDELRGGFFSHLGSGWWIAEDGKRDKYVADIMEDERGRCVF